MKNIYVGNTDNDWFDFLKKHQPLAEVNFWRPSRQHFRAIEEGEYFAFRLKSPRNLIGGYGMLVSSINATIRFAWENLGIENGTDSIDKMIGAIAKYRKDSTISEHTQIGCRVLIQPIFFDEKDWFEIPDDWSNSIVSGKSYSLQSKQGELLLSRLLERTDKEILNERDKVLFSGFHDGTKAKFGKPTEVLPRLGQAAFRLAVISTYGGRCAVTGVEVIDALDAAHIAPFGSEGTHEVTNGILLRKDIHSLFDIGLIAIDSQYQILVHPELKEEASDGNPYCNLAGQKISLPDDPRFWPSPGSLAKHRMKAGFDL